MIQIIAIRLVGGAKHEHIAEVRWTNPDDGKTGTTSRQGMVDWLRQDPRNQAFVFDGETRVSVHAVNANPSIYPTVRRRRMDR